MKKILYILLFAVVSSVAITSCTEEEVAPTRDSTATSGGTEANDPK